MSAFVNICMFSELCRLIYYISECLFEYDTQYEVPQLVNKSTLNVNSFCHKYLESAGLTLADHFELYGACYKNGANKNQTVYDACSVHKYIDI